MSSVAIRVDSEVYARAMLAKHFLEVATGGFVSMGDAIAFLLAMGRA